MPEADGQPEEHQQMDDVLDALMSFAVGMIEKRGGFIPFGAALTPPGEPTIMMAYGGDEHPDSTEVIAEL